MDMLKIIYFTLIAFTVVSCKPNSLKPIETLKKLDWEGIKQKGELIILAENSPASFFIYKGKNMGYEYELLHEFAKDYDIKLRIKMVQNLDSIYTQLYDFEGDLIACNLTITPERQKKVVFTTPHHITRQVLIQKKPDDWRKLKKTQ